MRRATLVPPAGGDPLARVAGMSVLLRQLLSLQDAGVEEVAIEGLPASAWPRDPRLRLSLVAGPTPDAEFSAALGLVWHRLLPRRLAESGYRGDLREAPLEPGEFVVSVSDQASARRAEDLLFRALLKATDGFVSRAINRPISLQVTRMLINTGLTPNQMTILAAGFGFLAIALVGWGGVGWLVPGALLLQVQSILDGCDGEISRLKYIRSRLGEWLDQVLDDVVNVGFFAVAGWALARAGSPMAWPVTVAGVGLHLVYQVALYTALVVRGGGSGNVTSIRWWGQAATASRAPTPPGPFRRFKEAVEMAGRRDFFTFLYLPASLLGMTEIALGWCAIIFAVSGLTTGLEWLLRGGPAPAGRPA